MRYITLFIKVFLRSLLKPLSFVPAILMMYIIFNFSAQPGAESSKLSGTVTERLVRMYDVAFDKGWDESMIEAQTIRFEGRVRKAAHVTEYFILGICVALPLYVYKVRGIWLILIAGAFCLGFAYLDEWHQSFVAERMSSKKDVMIDAMGIFPGIILAQMCGYIGKETIFSWLVIKKKEK